MDSENTLNFTKMEGVENLKQPVRVVEFTVGGQRMLLPRSGDDKTPDNVINIGGVRLDVRTGEMTVK